MSPADKPRVVRCPACGGASPFGSTNPWRPFCSERCKSHDFGAWASERYRVADPSAAGHPDADDAESPPRH